MRFPQPTARRLRLIAMAAGGVLAVSIAFAMTMLNFGWAYLRAPLESRLSARLGLPVTIGALQRTGHGFGDAVIELRDVRVGQPAWVGGGDLARVRRARVTVPIRPLLWGSVRPRAIVIDAIDITLLRRVALPANWNALPRRGASVAGPERIVIRDGRLHFRDTRRDHLLEMRFAADARGFRLAGGGTLIGRPVQVAIRGAPLGGGGRWPFQARYRSPIANADVAAVADGSLDLGHFDARVRAWGDDLQHLDLLVEAGLPATAPVRRLDVTLRRDSAAWALRSVEGLIGRSAFHGDAAVDRIDGRTRLDGAVVATTLDFDDLANARGRAIAAARHAAAPGRRLPDTMIDLRRLMKIDATLAIDVRRLLTRTPSVFRAMRGRVTLDHGTLTADPFTAVLTRGTLGGPVIIRQRGATTRLALDLRLRSRLESFGDGALTGPLDGRFVLAGPGGTIRAALGRADGRIALIARDGAIGRRIALLLGRDVGRGLFADRQESVRLRCGIGSFAVAGGQGRARSLVIDTDVARAEGHGMIDLTDERIALSMTGNPKQRSALRFQGPITVGGALFAPQVAAPQAGSAKAILQSIGRAISGKAQTVASDADCAGLAAAALR